MDKNPIRLLLYASVLSSYRGLVSWSIFGLLPILAILAFSGSAEAQTGYCMRKVGEDGRGISVRLEANNDNCGLFAAVRQYPHGRKDGVWPLRQEQMRSIWAANLVPIGDGKYSQPIVKRSCSEPTPKREAGTSVEENTACPKSQAFYYALPDAVVLIPRERALTPFELNERKAAEAAERSRRERDAAEAAVRAREESEAFRRAVQAEKNLAAEREKSAGLQRRLDEVADKAWRVTTFPGLVGMLALAVVLAVLFALLTAHYRFRLRAITADGYVFVDPREAVRDLVIRLGGARNETEKIRSVFEAERAVQAKKYAELEGVYQAVRTELAASALMNANSCKELEGLRLENQNLRTDSRNAGSTSLKQASVELQEQNDRLVAAYNDLDEAYKKSEESRKNQYVQLIEQRANAEEQRERIVRLERMNSSLAAEVSRSKDGSPDSTNPTWGCACQEPNQAAALASLFSTEANDEIPTRVRIPTIPIGVVPMARNDAPEMPAGDAQEPEDVFVGLYQELTDVRAERDIFRQGMQRISECLSWGEPFVGKVSDLRRQVEKVVDTASEACRIFVTSQTSMAENLYSTDRPLPMVTQSDVIRMAKLAELLNTDVLNIPAVRNQLSDCSSSAVRECLRACLREWSRRSDAEVLVYDVNEPHELFSLHRFLVSPLDCGLAVRTMLPHGFTETVDRVHHARAPAFSRRAAGWSVPPPAVPQAVSR